MSPATISIFFWSVAESSHPREPKELYRTSALTSCPSLTRCSTRCEPMNPSAPVIRIFLFLRSMLRPTCLALQLLELALERLVLLELSLQEARGHLRFLLDAARREVIQIRPLVGVVAEVVRLDQALLDQCLDAEIYSAETDTELICDSPLARMRVGLEQFEDAVAGLVGQHV